MRALPVLHSNFVVFYCSGVGFCLILLLIPVYYLAPGDNFFHSLLWRFVERLDLLLAWFKHQEYGDFFCCEGIELVCLSQPASKCPRLTTANFRICTVSDIHFSRMDVLVVYCSLLLLFMFVWRFCLDFWDAKRIRRHLHSGILLIIIRHALEKGAKRHNTHTYKLSCG